MPRCFVIQPFDGGEFDNRYDDILAPAIKAASLEPYRVDRDHTATIPIEQIQEEIEKSRVCLADISTENPNVWFEVGYAIASRRDVVMICSSKTTKFPFDVQHRAIIKYGTSAPRDFTKLQENITQRLKALLSKEADLGTLANMSPVVTIQGLEQFEIACLVAIAQRFGDGVPTHTVQRDLEKAGLNELATSLGLRGLLKKGMVTSYKESQFNSDEYTVFEASDAGFEWLYDNRANLKLTFEPTSDKEADKNDDDIFPKDFDTPF